jgi:hypothetical protein
MAALRDRLARPGSFVVATEIVTSRGLVTANGGGGVLDCEVDDTECIWSQAYERLKAYGEEESMLDGPVVVKDNALAGTSAWANAFLGRDHVGRESGT